MSVIGPAAPPVVEDGDDPGVVGRAGGSDDHVTPPTVKERGAAVHESAKHL